MIKEELVKDLTVSELKALIKQVIKEEITYIGVPTYQPIYYQPVQPMPYKQPEVWATTSSQPIKRKQSSDDINY